LGELARRERADVHQDLPEAPVLALLLLHRTGEREISFSDLAGADQHRSERMRIAPDARIHHTAVLEPDLSLVAAQLRAHGERPGLSAEVEQLKDVVDAEIAKRALDRHQAASVTLP